MNLLRMPAVKAIMGYRSHTSIYSAIRAGLFTRPVRISPRHVGWPEREVMSLSAADGAGMPKELVREFVRAHHLTRVGTPISKEDLPDFDALTAFVCQRTHDKSEKSESEDLSLGCAQGGIAR